MVWVGVGRSTRALTLSEHGKVSEDGAENRRAPSLGPEPTSVAAGRDAGRVAGQMAEAGWQPMRAV